MRPAFTAAQQLKNNQDSKRTFLLRIYAEGVNVMGKFARSWQLAKESAKILLADKELIFFPVLSACISFIAVIILTTILAGIGLFVPGAANALSDESSNIGTVGGFVILFIFYLVTSFIVTYFTSGLVGAALIRLRGDDPNFGDGIRIANQHIGPIFIFAIMSATVGVLTAIIRGNQRNRNIARSVAAGLTEFAWNLASFLAVPIIVSRPVGAPEALKQSTLLLKKTWGEQIIGNAGIGLVFAVPFILLVIGGIFGIVALANAGQGTAALVLLAVIILLIALLAVIQTALTGIYKAAVYLYAAEHVETPAFDPALVRTAFQPARA
jgi:hypothetical protein